MFRHFFLILTVCWQVNNGASQKLLITEYGVTTGSAIVTSPTPLLSQWHIHGLQVCGCLCIDEPRMGQQAAAGCWRIPTVSLGQVGGEHCWTPASPPESLPLAVLSAACGFHTGKPLSCASSPSQATFGCIACGKTCATWPFVLGYCLQHAAYLSLA